ncbi:MAG TPA: Uma2 family endonuclease [Polyangiaceae bacterium]
MAQPVISTEAPLPADNIVVLRNVTWADYQRHLEIRGDRSVPRMTYLEGVLELMSPSRPHEMIKSMIGRLVEAWCLEMNVGITPYGSWTHESKESDRGGEPDECYVLGDDPDPARCDLAIEVIWTSGGIDKLEVYRKLAVREVWIWKRSKLEVFELRDEQYVRLERSKLLPALDLDELVPYIDTKPMTRAVSEYRAALRARK